MAKMRMNSGRDVLKISSDRLEKSNWDLTVNVREAKSKGDIVTLGDSELLRFIRDINGYKYSEEDIKSTKKNIKSIRRLKNTESNKKKIAKLYNELHDMVFIEDLVSIVFKTKKDFDRACKGFKINGKTYIRMLGTTGGVKNNTVFFVNKDIHKELNERINNGCGEDYMIVPAKMEAYRALTASVSTPLNITPRLLVIKDVSRIVTDKVIRVSDNGDGGFKVERNVDYETEKEFCDGCGMVSPKFAEKIAIDLDQYHFDKDGNKIADYIPSAFNTRYAYNKGIIATFPFVEFAEDIAGTYMVEDAWGDIRDIRDIDIVLTTNMLKCWNAYENMEDYLSNCNKYGYRFSISKILPKELERTRNTNYQYIQSYEDMTREDAIELASETLNNIKGALGGDIWKAILFTRGKHITEGSISKSDPDFNKALMIDKSVINDPYIKQQINKMISRKINDAKKCVLQISGTYSIVVGDLYGLCEGMFGMEVTGILGKDEYYSRDWNNKGVSEVVAFRSPMTSHNNITKMKLVKNDMTEKWFRYLDTVTVLTSLSTVMERMNGMDHDGDAIITTNNPVILRNTRNELTIVCEQRSVPKTRVTEALLRKSNKNGFGDAIGTYTNRITTMFDVLATLEKGSDEYNELMDRIIQGQAFQQEMIDKIKGIEAKLMPRSWWDYKTNKINIDKETGEILDDDETLKRKRRDLKLMVNKKPYFFIYNYNSLRSEYNEFMKQAEYTCLAKFGKTFSEVCETENKTDEEQFIYEYVNKRTPVFNNGSITNTICHILEEEFNDIKLTVKDGSDFDYKIYKSSVSVPKKIVQSIGDVYKKYKARLKEISLKLTVDSDLEIEKQEIFEALKEEMQIICPDSKAMCNAVIDITYGKNVNKEFAWIMCGEQIIENLLEKNDYTYTYPVLDKDGDIEWEGYKFKAVEWRCV